MSSLTVIEGKSSLPISLEEALQAVLSHTLRLDAQQVPLGDSLGYVLAQPIVADHHVPLFDRSMMDGYAVRWEDTINASDDQPVKLQVIGEIAAGDCSAAYVSSGQAVRIMTGAKIPAGATAVCRFEATQEGFAKQLAHILVMKPQRMGENIARQGEDMAAGAQVLASGKPITPASVAVLATFGVAAVPVVRKPVVAVIATGSELVTITEQPKEGQIRDSNSWTTAALLKEAGYQPLVYQPSADDAEALARTIRSALDEADVVITTGGVSVGDYDLMPEVYRRLGASSILSKVRMRPGSPFRFATLQGKPLFGLSGNVAASFINMQLLVLPALRAMSGFAQPESAYMQAVLAEGERTIASITQADRFLRASAYVQEGRLSVKLAQGQSSGMLGSFVGCNALVRIPAGDAVQQGDTVRLLLYGALQVG